jgi:hypothetical protein
MGCVCCFSRVRYLPLLSCIHHRLSFSPEPTAFAGQACTTTKPALLARRHSPLDRPVWAVLLRMAGRGRKRKTPRKPRRSTCDCIGTVRLHIVHTCRRTNSFLQSVPPFGCAIPPALPPMSASPTLPSLFLSPSLLFVLYFLSHAH